MTVENQGTGRPKVKSQRAVIEVVQVVSGWYRDFFAFIIAVPVAGFVALIVGIMLEPLLEPLLGTLLLILLVSANVSFLMNSHIHSLMELRGDDESEQVINARPSSHFSLPILFYLIAIPSLGVFGPDSVIGQLPLLFATTSMVYRTSLFGRVVHSASMGPKTVRAFLGITLIPITSGGAAAWVYLLFDMPSDPRFVTLAGYEMPVYESIVFGVPLFLSVVYIVVQFTASIPARKDGRRPGQPPDVHEHLTEADELRLEAESLHDSGEYDDALNAYERAVDAYDRATRVAHSEHDYTREDSRIDAIKSSILEAQEDVTKEKISSLREQAEQLTSKADSTWEVIESEEASEPIGGYNDAIDRYRNVIDKYEDAIDALEEALQIAKNQNSVSFSEVIFELKNQRAEYKEAIEDIQEDAARQAVQQLQTSADDILSEARDNRQAGDYDAAIGAYHRAREVFEKAIDAAKQGQRDTTEFENEISEIDDAIKETMQERAIDELTVHRERIDELVANAESARDADDFETAIDAYEAASDTYREAIELADGHSLSARSSRLQNRLDELDATLQDTKIDHIAHRLGNLTDRMEIEDDYESLEEAFRTLLDETDALTVDPEQERALSNLEQKALRGRIKARIEHGREQMRQGVDAFECEAYDEAVEFFEAAVDHFETTHDLANEHHFSDEQHELEQLIDSCETNADTATKGKLGILDANPSVVGPTAATSNHETSEPVEPPARNRVEMTEKGQSMTARNSGWFDNSPPTHDRIEELGRGGNATVFAIELNQSGRRAALKEPNYPGTMDQRVMESFAEEAAAWSRIDDHDHVVNIYDWGGTPQPWILLEYMEGGSLAERVESITLARAIDVFAQVCEAIHHAHHTVDVGAHLDLKPDNILFTDYTDDAIPKVSDWGMAKGALKRTGSSAGWTPKYAAPEQIDPKQFGDTGAKTDVYQLGVVAYELLTGQRPFEYNSATALENAIRSETPTPPSQIADLPPGVDEPILTALSKRKKERQETVLYLRDGLIDASK